MCINFWGNGSIRFDMRLITSRFGSSWAIWCLLMWLIKMVLYKTCFQGKKEQAVNAVWTHPSLQSSIIHVHKVEVVHCEGFRVISVKCQLNCNTAALTCSYLEPVTSSPHDGGMMLCYGAIREWIDGASWTTGGGCPATSSEFISAISFRAGELCTLRTSTTAVMCRSPVTAARVG